MVSRLSCSFPSRIHAEPPQKTLGEPQITTLHNHLIACTSAKSSEPISPTPPPTIHPAMCQPPPTHCTTANNPSRNVTVATHTLRLIQPSPGLCASHHPHIGAKPEAQHTTSPANKPNPKPNKPPNTPMCQPPLAHCAAACQTPRLPSKTASSTNRQVQPTGRFN